MIGTRVTVTVDRPLGSAHPICSELRYPVNYGYIKGIFGGDGEEQDAYILGVDTPLETFSGMVIAVICRGDDVEDKWVVVPDGMYFTTEEIRKMVEFQEQYFSSVIRTIRPARPNELSTIQTIYVAARRFMAANGNPHQWGEHYPSDDLLSQDMAAQQLYVEEMDGELSGAFVLALGDDPTYAYIEDGAWLSDTAYGTIHRIASNGIAPGLFNRCVSFCESKIPHLRVDTHHDNAVMQHLALKAGFQRCGIIYLANGSPRIAYEKLL